MLIPSDIQNLIEADESMSLLFHDVVACSFSVYNEFHGGLLESAYEAALVHLLTKLGYKVFCQVELPIYFQGEKLKKNYRLDLVVDDKLIVELKAINFVGNEQRRQLWNYMRLTHVPYGILINFGEHAVFSQKYYYDEADNACYEVL